jgi:hypothetical protein
MATMTNRLMGEVIENPEGQERDVGFLLSSLLRTLLEEQKLLDPTPQQNDTPEAQ